MYLHRKVDDYLAQWKQDSDRKPLIIKGCRQIGKTESIRHFAKQNYESIIEINFVEEEKYKTIISDGYSADSVVKNISLIDPSKRFIEGNTLIFFDELQSFPAIATALKFFKQDGRFDVICSGSLLGLNYQEIESNSVGYKTDFVMYSLDFEEFLWAKGYDQSTVENMLDHLVNGEPFSKLEMDVYHSLFLDYCVLGGMPEIVGRYIEKNTFEGSLQLQRQINHDYEEDIRKYLSGLEQTKVLNIYRNLPAQLAKENKKFQISKVAKYAKNNEYLGSIEWLKDSGIINICYCLNFPELPLKGNYVNNKYKLYYADTGILVSNLDEEAQEDLRARKNLGVYKGALYENFVAEGLNKQGYDLYYYQKENSTLEMDFFIRSKDSLIPIEVKASNQKAKSLITMIRSEHYSDIKTGIKLSYGNVGFANGYYNFPYFCTFLLKRYIRQKDSELSLEQSINNI
jgi:predicted AAA+ superfamily ATPase